jgi:menaquinone-dependent protoporphyrinogen oxidase
MRNREFGARIQDAASEEIAAMNVLIVHATTEGQTGKIARHVAEHLRQRGHAVELLAASAAEGLDPSRFDAAVLAGSVHVGQYQEELRRYARTAARALNDMKTLFVSVSLTAAGDDADERRELEACVRRLVEETGWQPGRVEHVAGALRFSQYGFFQYWAMRWIARQRGEKPSGREDVEFTDWAALEAMLDDWIGG